MANQIESIGEILKDKKDIDNAKKRINNKREAFQKKTSSYFSSKEVKDFSFLAPQGCVSLMSPLYQAEELVEQDIAAYLKLDPNKKYENIRIEDSGRAVYVFNCKHKTSQSGQKEQEEYALIYMTNEEYNWLRSDQARGFKEGYNSDLGYKEGTDAAFAAESESIKSFTEEPKKKK